MGQLWMLLQVAIRNLFASFLNIIIGGIILIGTLLVVVGSSLLDSLDRAMSRSITGSVGGDIQVYSNKSKDELALFGSFGGYPEVAPIPDFSKIKTSLREVSNVKTIVPMGINVALVTSGNTIDLTLEKLRNAVRKILAGDRSPEPTAEVGSLKQHVHQMVRVLQNDLKNYQMVVTEQALEPRNVSAINEAASDRFWANFDNDPLNALEFLENQIGPQVPDADLLFLGYIGTDPEMFQQSFDRMRIVDGQMIPKGERGFLIPKLIYEERFKLKTARRLDKIREAIHDESKKIANSPELQRMVKENRTQIREFLLQLDPLRTKLATQRLAAFLKTPESDLGKLIAQFFDTDDQNFDLRYKFFYDQLAPLIDLYRIRPGDHLTIKAFGRSGYVQSVNVKVYGTFNFEGLEKAGLAGGLGIMDLISFRDLYGYVTPDKLAEIKRLQEASGAKILDRDQAESALFGGGAPLVGNSKSTPIDEGLDLGAKQKQKGFEKTYYTVDDIDHGVVLNAAIILKDPSKLKKTLVEIQQVSDHAHLDLKVVSWQQASGLIGQFVLLAKLVLYFAVFIIFIVALVVINNAVMMATIQRVREIGTMRAIGAQRGFVRSLVLLETIVLGLAFGGVGAVLGSVVMKVLNSNGIPAKNDFLYFFFSGPRLYPTLGASNLIAAFVIILLVTSLSTLYPAIVATRVTPVTAMQADE